jgi:hypothetical protein
MRSEDPEPAAWALVREGDRRFESQVRGNRHADVPQAGRQVCILKLFQLRSQLSNVTEGGETLLVITPMLLEEFLNEPFQNLPVVGRQGPLALKDPGQRSGLVVDPGIETGDKLLACQKIALQGDNAEQQLFTCEELFRPST